MSYAASDLQDTITALSTPPGRGAIAVIRLSGPKAITIIDGLFPTKDLTKQQSHTAHFGSIRNEHGKVLDEVVVTLFKGPNSYTGDDVVEVSCHGSPYIVQQLLQQFISSGARFAQAGEFTLRAFLNGKLDLSQAEAVADLIASGSEAAHRVAIQQMRGGFSSDIQALRTRLIDFASLIELELDFGEEDVEFADREELRELVQQIQKVLADLLRSFSLGNAIKEGITTVIAGRPNAGKSTLLNALIKEERAIVSDIPGTTRDTIEEILYIEGIPFRIIDTAGIREAEDTVEAIGVEKTMEKVAQSSLLVYVFDILETQPEEVRADLAKLSREGLHILVVANKMDLNPYTKYEHYFGDDGEVQVPERNFIPIIAREGMNIPFLKERLYEAVLEEKVDADQTIVSNARHYAALESAYAALDDVLRGMQEGVTADFVAMDIRRSLHHLGEITGEISTDDLLGNIFGKFCIGK